MSTTFECVILSSDVLEVRDGGDTNAVVFRTGRREKGGCSGKEYVEGLDVYLGYDDVLALIEQLQEYVEAKEPDSYEVVLASEYADDSSLSIEHNPSGRLPSIATSEGLDVYLNADNLRKLRELIDFSLAKIARD